MTDQQRHDPSHPCRPGANANRRSGTVLVSKPRSHAWRHQPSRHPGRHRETICDRGWTRTVRPPERYTEALKRRQILEYGYEDRRLRDFEEDHLIPLDLGGAPRDPRNLWPEARYPRDGWTADRKDELEGVLVRLVCSGRLPLDVARRAIATDWQAAYRRYVSRF